MDDKAQRLERLSGSVLPAALRSNSGKAVAFLTQAFDEGDNISDIRVRMDNAPHGIVRPVQELPQTRFRVKLWITGHLLESWCVDTLRGPFGTVTRYHVALDAVLDDDRFGFIRVTRVGCGRRKHLARNRNEQSNVFHVKDPNRSDASVRPQRPSSAHLTADTRA